MEIRTVVTWIFAVLLGAGFVAVTENYKEWLKQSGGNTLLVRIVDKILPSKLQERLSWKYLRTMWWCWLIFGIVLALWLTPFLTNLQTKWSLASDETTIKAVLPAEIFADWETKKHTADDLAQPDTEQRLVPQEIFADRETKKQRVNDLTHQLNELVAQQISYGKPPSSADIDALRLQVQRAAGELHDAQGRVNEYIEPKRQKALSERTSAQARIEKYLRQQLGTGKLIARGIPNDAPPHDNEQIIIKPAQWQYLRLSISTADATDNKGTVFKGVEIGTSKKLPDLP